MYLIYNGHILNKDKLPSSIFERAYNYGDGLFETLIGSFETVNYLSYHFERLAQGASVMQIDLPAEFNLDKIESNIRSLILKNGIQGFFKVKILLWRKTGGLYTPFENAGDYIVQVQKINEPQPFEKSVGISQDSRVFYSKTSRFKTCNAMPYVMASLEMKARKLDELIILDIHENVAECTSSNLFWKKNGTYYTPSLKTGCIEGIMRRVLIEKYRSKGFEVHEVEARPEILKEADEVFCCNVTGIYPLKLKF